MPEPADASASPVAEDSPPAAPAPSSESTDAPLSGYRPFSLSRALGVSDSPSSAVSSEDKQEPPKPETSGESGASVSEETSKPDPAPAPGEAPAGDDAPKLSRRAAAAEASKARIAELEAELQSLRDGTPAESDTPSPPDAAALREQIRAELAAEETAKAERAAQEQMSANERADIERYERLCRTPDADLSDEDYRWREARKALLAQFPEAERHLKAEAARVIDSALEAREAEIAERQGAFTADLLSQIQETASLPNVDDSPWSEPGTTWAKMGRDLHAAGAAWKEAELGPQIAERDEKIARLEEQIKDLRLVGPRGLGSARTPVEGGRSAGSAPGHASTFDETRHWRRNLADALTGTSGSS